MGGLMTSALLRTALAVLGLIVLQLAILGTAAAQQMDPPVLPHQFYGTVTLNGTAAPDGTLVSLFSGITDSWAGMTRRPGNTSSDTRTSSPGTRTGGGSGEEPAALTIW